MRVVLDTSSLVRTLNSAGWLSRFRKLWQERRFAVLVSPAILVEYEKVLRHPRLGFPRERIDLMLQAFQPPLVERIRAGEGALPHPVRDRSDEAFLRAALAGGAAALVSEDKDLLVLDGKLPFPVLTADGFLKRFFPKSPQPRD